MNSMKRLLLLGGGYMQLPVVHTACAMGITLIIADGNKNAVARVFAKEFWHIDLRDIPLLIAKAKENAIDAVITCGTDFSYAVSCIAEACKLPSISKETAQKANFKHYMRNAFSEKDIPIPRWVSINEKDIKNESYCKEKAKEIGYPFVIKPSDNMGARGILLVESESRLIPAIHHAISYSVSRTILFEQKLTGPELSIDSFILDGKIYSLGIADRHIVFNPYFIEVGHDIPSRCSMKMKENAISVLEKAAISLGIINGVCKGDIIFHHKKAYIGECAARLSGGYMSGWTIPYAYRTHPTYYAIQLALGKNIKRKVAQLSIVSPKNYVLERSLLMLPGILIKIRKTIAFHTDIPCIYKKNNYSDKSYLSSQEKIPHIYIRVRLRKKYNFPKNNTEKAGSIIVVEKSLKKATAVSSHALLNIYFDIKRNATVERFLYEPFTTKHFSCYGTWYCYPLLGKILIHKAIDDTKTKKFLSQTLFMDISKRIDDCVKIGTMYKKDKGIFSFPFYIPKVFFSRKERGTWTHISIPKAIHLAIKEKYIYSVKDIKQSINALLFPAFVRAGWQGLHYTVQLIQNYFI